MLTDGKSLASAIVAKMHTTPSSDEDTASGPDSPPAGPDAGLASAADDFIAAVKSGDSQGLVAALKSAFQLLQSEPDGDE